jgi:mono/diheme cytochrome c family protein
VEARVDALLAPLRLATTQCLVKQTILALLVVCAALCGSPTLGAAVEADVLRPRVPTREQKSLKLITNPFSATPEIIAKGKALYETKGTCDVCHGLYGKGLGLDINRASIKGSLPRDFTDKAWQRARSDGEILWVLKNGSPGTGMPSFVPQVLTEEEAFQIIQYIRFLPNRK